MLSFSQTVFLHFQNTNIELRAAVYSVRGEFMRWENVGGGNLQVGRHDQFLGSGL